MNRVESAILAKQIEKLVPSDSLQLAWTGNGQCDRPRLFEPAAPVASFMPMHYEQGYAYPLLVWLHGGELDEDSLPELMPYISVRNYVAVAPRGTCESDSGHGFTWCQDNDSIADAEEAVDDAIDRAREQFNIHSDRILIAGYGVGGTMALRIAMRRPRDFAAAASLAGPLPRNHAPIRSLDALRDLPMLIASGRESAHYDQRAACDDLRLLHSAGCQLSIRQYPDDELRDTMLGDMNNWMMDIVCGQKVAK